MLSLCRNGHGVTIGRSVTTVEEPTIGGSFAAHRVCAASVTRAPRRAERDVHLVARCNEITTTFTAHRTTRALPSAAVGRLCTRRLGATRFCRLAPLAALLRSGRALAQA